MSQEILSPSPWLERQGLAPAKPPEVTKAMIDAANYEFYKLAGLCVEEWIVIAVYRAMEAARNAPHG